MNIPTLQQLIEAKAHFGHRKALSVPQANEFIFGIKNGINVINLELTQQRLNKALDYIAKLTREKKVILFVGTKNQAKNIITELAKACSMPYVNNRWLGGTLTNFNTINKRIKYYLELEAKLNSEEAKNYTKKERTMWQKELNRLAKFFEGIKNVKTIPDALFIVDTAEEYVAVTEAKKVNIPVIGLGNTDSNPNNIDYFIPINDNSELAIKLVCKLVKEAIEKGKLSKEDKITKIDNKDKKPDLKNDKAQITNVKSSSKSK